MLSWDQVTDYTEGKGRQRSVRAEGSIMQDDTQKSAHHILYLFLAIQAKLRMNERRKFVKSLLGFVFFFHLGITAVCLHHYTGETQWKNIQVNIPFPQRMKRPISRSSQC